MNKDEDKLEFQQLAIEIKKWFKDRDIDVGYTDTNIGHFALYIQEKNNEARQQLLDEIEAEMPNAKPQFVSHVRPWIEGAEHNACRKDMLKIIKSKRDE